MNYLGIDLGDGESAAALLTEDSVIEPVVQALGRQKSILSVVGQSNGHIVIGESALLDGAIENLRARFKSRFLRDPSARADVRRFAMGLYEALAGIDQSDLRVALGVPAGWTEKERGQYAQLLREAGFQNLYTVSESRAAFLYCKHSHSLKVDAALLQKPALVIDIGSSTTDFAYIVDGQEKRIGTFGHIHLGGGLIDAAILADAAAQSPLRARVEDVFMQEAAWKHYAELAARRLKEMYFLREDGAALYDTVTLYYDDPPVPLHIKLDAAAMDRLLKAPIEELNGRSFLEALDITLRDAATATREKPPELIILTGGASRMGFFRDKCREVFPDAAITIAGEPEFTTAKGLCYAARVDSRIALFTDEMRAYFASGAVQKHVDAMLDELAAAIAPGLTDFIIESAVIPAVLKWRDGEGGSLNDLEKKLNRQIEHLLTSKDAQGVIAPHIQTWSRRLIKSVQKDLDAILRRAKMALALEALSSVRTDAQVDELALVLPTDGLGAVVIALSGYIAATLLGGTGTALLTATGMTGPLTTLLVGAVIGVALGVMGTAYGKTKARDMPLPLFLRRAIPKALLKKSLSGDKQRRRVEGMLFSAMTDREGVFCRTLIHEVSADLTRQLDRFQRDEEVPLAI